MVHYIGGSQSRDVMREKREKARELLGRGLRVQQVAAQLRCSRQVVRQVRGDVTLASRGHVLGLQMRRSS